MKVEMFNQWTANTVSFDGNADLYLRLSAEGQVVWYETGENDCFSWMLDPTELEQAWLGRNSHEDLQ